MLKEPKWGHLRDLHTALKLCRKGLLWGTPSVQNFDKGLEVRKSNVKKSDYLIPEASVLVKMLNDESFDLQARLYQSPESNVCVAFLTNTKPKEDGSVNFRGTDYHLPRRSITILPDCKTVVFNTQKVISP